MKWIDAGDIKSWVTSKQRHCQQAMPELVRRLILATAGTIEEIDFPSGDSIATGGWDGRLKTPVVTPFFPSGMSGWEIGVERSPGKKAEEDYTKRTSDPLGLTPQETAFVFVTPRSFPNRGKWQSDKRSTSEWKDVRVINAGGLEQWLESAPAVGLWLARQIGKVISSAVRDLEAVWEEWSIGTEPTMTRDLVIGGRTKDVEAVQKWIADRPRILEVQGDHPDEAFAFLYASIATLPEIEKTQALARCVVVERISDLREITSAFQSYPLIIAAPGECINAVHAAIAKGHRVFITMDATVVGIRDILRLSRPQRGVVEKILHESGLSEAEAERIARDSGRSIPVLRRHLFQSNAVSAPKWANAESARILLPALFANTWDENRDGDRPVLEALSRMNYDAFVSQLIPFLSIEDSPLRKVGSVWMIKSPLDAWFLLAPNLTREQLTLFEQSLLAVLTKTDPKYELDTEKRWAASIYGKSNPYSEWLRTGLVESLVLLAVYGNRSPSTAPTQAFADHVVREVFATADKWESWASIKDATPLLAEAAPDTLMESVEEGISKIPDIFKELMKDDDTVFGECRHSGLLWALEGIAWSSEYFGRAVSVLLEIAKIDPGGRWDNRAINSLKDIFLPGFPQTHASPQERLAVLDSLIAKDSQLVWKFTQNYYSSGSVSESHRFRWRDTGGQRRGLEAETNEDYGAYLKGLFPKLRDLACAKENLISAVDEFTRLPLDIRDSLISTLEATDPNSFSKEERARLLQCIREALHWVNSYGDEERRKQVPDLNHLLERFKPEDVIERVGWLLSTPWPRLPQGDEKRYDAEDVLIKTAQEEAAREMLDKTTLDKIVEFAGTVNYPGVPGYSLAKVVRDEEEDASLLDAFLEHIADMALVIRGYAQGRVEVTGPGWIDEQIERMKTKGNYSPEACALLYFGLPESGTTWSAVSGHGREVENAYWKQASGHSRTGRNEDAPIAVEKLMDAKRPDAALQIAGGRGTSIPSHLLQRLLQELLTLDEKKIRGGAMDVYHLGHVFNQIYERNELPIGEIAKLEWPYAALFKEIRQYISSPMALHKALQEDPLFFTQLIKFVYKRDDHTPDPEYDNISEEMRENRWRVAHEVLNSWDLIPGLKDDGTFDERELSDWVDAARKQCAETNHVTGGDIQIGFMLARAPSDADGAWPHTAVRNLIERLNNGLIEDHIRNGLINSRGVVSRGLSDGGKQERELADKYRKMSASVKGRWPRTAAMLRSVANNYEGYARHEDIESDLRDLLSD
jgi:hypothetical protein